MSSHSCIPPPLPKKGLVGERKRKEKNIKLFIAEERQKENAKRRKQLKESQSREAIQRDAVSFGSFTPQELKESKEMFDFFSCHFALTSKITVINPFFIC